jgi:hypothetical protein
VYQPEDPQFVVDDVTLIRQQLMRMLAEERNSVLGRWAAGGADDAYVPSLSFCVVKWCSSCWWC